jgi:hypothetical protein
MYKLSARFHERFAYKTERDAILHFAPVTMVCPRISENINLKLTCGTPWAANRT